MINLELFSCAGGLAEGFRRAGVTFDVAVDFTADHCDSYERNLGHRPIAMDVHDLARLVSAGWRAEIDLLIADPPCTPWSRAGKRRGVADERDMLVVTCELVAALRPRRWLICNIPGLDDSTNLAVVQRTIGALAVHGYCAVDYKSLDAADYGVPQRRARPFWFGHREGPCIRWPAPTHADPAALASLSLPGMDRRLPWVTCRDALGHLVGDALGRPVRMRRRNDNCHQKGSVAGRPARTVGTSNLSDGNVLTYDAHHPPSVSDQPAMVVRAGSGGGANRGLVFHYAHAPAELDSPSPTVCGGKRHLVGAEVLMLDGGATARRGRNPTTRVPQSERTIDPDGPASVVHSRPARQGSGAAVMSWPWDRPSTVVTSDPNGRQAPAGGHEGSWLSDANAVLLSELAATILQGFPETWVWSGKTKNARWQQIGQAVPPALAAAVARSIVEQNERGETDG